MHSQSAVSDSCDPMDCSPPGSSGHGILQAKTTGVGCHALLQGIFSTPGLDPSLLPWQVDATTKPPGKPRPGKLRLPKRVVGLLRSVSLQSFDEEAALGCGAWGSNQRGRSHKESQKVSHGIRGKPDV